MEEMQNYQLPETPQPPVVDKNNLPMSLGQWLLTLLPLAVPVVNIILLIVWSFLPNINVNRKNFARAALIIFPVLYILLFIIILLIFSLYATVPKPY